MGFRSHTEMCGSFFLFLPQLRSTCQVRESRIWTYVFYLHAYTYVTYKRIRSLQYMNYVFHLYTLSFISANFAKARPSGKEDGRAPLPKRHQPTNPLTRVILYTYIPPIHHIYIYVSHFFLHTKGETT